METIKRINQLWTNDSLYLRDYILIPLPNSIHDPLSPTTVSTDCVQPQQNGTSHSLSTDNLEIITRQDLMRNKTVPRSKSCTDSVTTQCDKSKESTVNSDANAKDFLKKFDFSIAEIKRNVERLDANTK